jgi:internalin A
MVYHGTGPTRLQNDQFTDEALHYMARFSKIRLIALAWTQATDEGFKHLAGATSLRAIHVRKGAQLTDVGIESLHELKDLEEVHVDNSNLTDASLRTLSTMPKVESLALQGNNFTDDGLAYLSEMKQLKSLSVGMSKSQITDAGAAHLANLVNLEALDLQKARISDEGVKHLIGLTKLKSISLTGGGDSPFAITDQGLAILASLPNLERLFLINSRITEAGIAQLASMKKLRHLSIGSANLDGAAISRLRQALPRVKVLYCTP